MKKMVVLLFAFVFLFGCIGGEEQPPGNGPAVGENGSDIGIIIEEEQNVSVAVNETGEEEEPEEVWEGIDYSEEPGVNLGIYFLDACDYGTGDHGAAIFIKKGDLDILVDGGSFASGSRVLDYLKLRGVDDIDVLVSTTGDYRRYGGLDAIIDEFEIEEFWWGGNDYADSTYAGVVDKAIAKAKNVRIVERGYKITLNGIEIEALNPRTAARFDDINNDAIVLRIYDRNMSVLLMSNIQVGAQGDLTSNLKDEINVDVIEAPYYGVGQGTANIALFLQDSLPGYAVIEGCSDETMEVEGSTRTPFKRIMDQEQYDVTYFETYADGTVRIIVDESGWDIGPAN